MTRCQQWSTPEAVILPPVPTDEHPRRHRHQQQQRQSDRRRRRRRRSFLRFVFHLAVAAAAAVTSTAAGHRHSFAVAVDASSDRAAAAAAAASRSSLHPSSWTVLHPRDDYKQLSVSNHGNSLVSARRLQETTGTASTAAGDPLASTDPTPPYNFLATPPNDITNEDAGDPLRQIVGNETSLSNETSAESIDNSTEDIPTIDNATTTTDGEEGNATTTSSTESQSQSESEPSPPSPPAELIPYGPITTKYIYLVLYGIDALPPPPAEWASLTSRYLTDFFTRNSNSRLYEPRIEIEFVKELGTGGQVEILYVQTAYYKMDAENAAEIGSDEMVAGPFYVEANRMRYVAFLKEEGGSGYELLNGCSIAEPLGDLDLGLEEVVAVKEAGGDYTVYYIAGGAGGLVLVCCLCCCCCLCGFLMYRSVRSKSLEEESSDEEDSDDESYY